MKKGKIVTLLLSAAACTMLLGGCDTSEVTDAIKTVYGDEEEPEDAGEDEEDADADAREMMGGENVGSEGESEDSEGGNTEEYTPEQIELIKYNIFVSLNDYVINVLNNINAYYQVVDNADEFSLLPDTGLSYGYDIHYLNTDILDDVSAALEYEPALGELDQLAGGLIEPMRVMMDSFNQISDAGTSFADDQYALPKELHPLIQKNAESFYALGVDYCDAVADYADEQVEKDEEKMLEEGKLIMYYSSHAITVTKHILDECDAQGVDDYNLTELDLSKIQPLYDELVEAVAGYDSAVTDNDQLIKESLSNSSPFDGLLNSLIQSMDYMMQAAQGSGIDDPELEPLGSLRHLNNVLNSTTDRYNSVFVD